MLNILIAFMMQFFLTFSWFYADKVKILFIYFSLFTYNSINSILNLFSFIFDFNDNKIVDFPIVLSIIKF